MMLTRPKEDIALIDAFRSGDKTLLDRFYLAHRQEFIRWAENTFRLSDAETMDVYQDASIVLIKNLAAGKLDHNGASLKTYLFAIGRNIALKLIKKRIEEEKAKKQGANEEEHDDTSEFTDRQKLAMALYENLPEPCKSILRMYYFEKLTMREIADKLEYSSEDVVKNQKCRCLKTIKDKILPSFKK